MENYFKRLGYRIVETLTDVGSELRVMKPFEKKKISKGIVDWAPLYNHIISWQYFIGDYL